MSAINVLTEILVTMHTWALRLTWCICSVMLGLIYIPLVIKLLITIYGAIFPPKTHSHEACWSQYARNRCIKAIHHDDPRRTSSTEHGWPHPFRSWGKVVQYFVTHRITLMPVGDKKKPSEGHSLDYVKHFQVFLRRQNVTYPPGFKIRSGPAMLDEFRDALLSLVDDFNPGPDKDRLEYHSLHSDSERAQGLHNRLLALAEQSACMIYPAYTREDGVRVPLMLGVLRMADEILNFIHDRYPGSPHLSFLLPHRGVAPVSEVVCRHASNDQKVVMVIQLMDPDDCSNSTMSTIADFASRSCGSQERGRGVRAIKTAEGRLIFATDRGELGGDITSILIQVRRVSSVL